MANRQVAIRGAGYGGAALAGNLAIRALRGEFDAETARARALGRRAREVYDDYRRARSIPRDNRMPSSGRGTRAYGGFRSGRSNRVVSRKRVRSGGRRRKLRWGTRVRQQALGLFEGKRFGTTLTNTAILTNIVKRHVPFVGMLTAVAPGVGADLGGANTIAKSDRVGMKIWVRGIATTLHVVNNSTTAACDIRIIAGWRRKVATGQTAADAGARLDIFRNRQTAQDCVNITETNEGINLPVTTISAPLASSKYFYCAKDMVVRLGPSSAGNTSEGSNFRLIKMWWELNNKINSMEKDSVG